MVAVEVFLTFVLLGLIALLVLAGVALLLGKRLRLAEWYRRDRRRLECLREREQAMQEARAEALRELETTAETDPPQVIQQKPQEK